MNQDEMCERGLDGRCPFCGAFYAPRVCVSKHSLSMEGIEFESNPFPVGDYTEMILASMGVTKDRWAKAKEIFGAAPEAGGCASCSQRQKDWNEWGRRVSEWWNGSTSNVD